MIVDNGFGYYMTQRIAVLSSSCGSKRILLHASGEVPEIKYIIGLEILKREPDQRDSRKKDIRIIRPITNKRARFLVQNYVIYKNLPILFDFSYIFKFESIDYEFFKHNAKPAYYLSGKPPIGFDRPDTKLLCFPKIKLP